MPQEPILNCRGHKEFFRAQSYPSPVTVCSSPTAPTTILTRSTSPTTLRGATSWACTQVTGVSHLLGCLWKGHCWKEVPVSRVAIVRVHGETTDFPQVPRWSMDTERTPEGISESRWLDGASAAARSLGRRGGARPAGLHATSSCWKRARFPQSTP